MKSLFTIFCVKQGWMGLVGGEKGVQRIYLPGIKKGQLRNRILSDFPECREGADFLSQAEKEFSLAMQDFAAQQERLKAEYEKRKQPIVDQMGAEQKEIEDGDIDHSLEARQAACEALVNAVNALVQKKGSSSQSGLEH